jgi:hypothetical protein
MGCCDKCNQGNAKVTRGKPTANHQEERTMNPEKEHLAQVKTG